MDSLEIDFSILAFPFARMGRWAYFLRMNMKRLSTLFLLSCFLLAANAHLLAEKIELCAASKVTFSIEMGSMSDQLEITGLQRTPTGGLSFSYKLNGYNIKEGSIAISPNALATARKLQNNFTGGEMDLGDKTSVLVSELVARELKKNGARIMPEASEMFFQKTGKAKIEVMVDGKAIRLKGLRGAASNGQSLTVWKDKLYPLILEMDLGWTMRLVSIETNC